MALIKDSALIFEIDQKISWVRIFEKKFYKTTTCLMNNHGLT